MDDTTPPFGPPRAIDPTARLKIIVLEESDEKPFTVVAQFNPKEVQVDAGVPWNDQNGYLEFVHPGLQSMSFELFFDGFETNESVAPQIVNLQKLTKRCKPSGDHARPPKVRVLWGADTSKYRLPEFNGVIESISVKYQMFSPEGDALRATATVKLKEAAFAPVGKEKKKH